MRNIKFDESTVLREFARLAQEQGLVKTAYELPVGRGPAADPKQLQQMQPQSLTPDVSIDTKNLKTGPTPAPDKTVSLAPEYSELSNAYTKLLAQYKGNTAAAQKAFVPYIKQFLNKLKQKYGPSFTPEILQKVQSDALQIAGIRPAQRAEDALASLEDVNVKQAKSESLYDVSGETGEDLVNQAHPGGGTKTELTHSKTKENLVETIVEQQEKDVEVARKAPKGTYAALVNLYVKLAKMGHASKLSGLKNAIRTVATPEEVTEHTLIVLADDLDRLGHTKYADRVDDLVKKKIVIAANPRTEQFLENLKTNVANLEKYESWSGGSSGHIRAILQQLNRLNPNTTLADAISQSESIFGQWNKSPIYTYLYATHTTLKNQLRDSLAQEQAELGQQQPGASKQVKMEPVTVTPKHGPDQKVLNWQKLYNKAVKGTNLPQIQEDGRRGPETNKALRTVRDSGAKSLDQFRQLISQKAPTDVMEGYVAPGSPLEGLEGAKKIDVLKADTQRNAQAVQPQLVKELENAGVDTRTPKGRSAITYLKDVVWQAAQEAVNKASATTFKDQASRDRAIQNYVLGRVRNYLTPENLAQYR